MEFFVFQLVSFVLSCHWVPLGRIWFNLVSHLIRYLYL